MLFTLLFGSMCSFLFDKASKLFIYGFNKEKLLQIDALRRLKMLFQRPYSSKSSGGARTWTSLAACALGAHDWHPNLATALLVDQNQGLLPYQKTREW